MDVLVSLLTALFVVNRATTEYCTEGEDEGCRYECHCANDNECREGICPGGCDTSALGYNWRGPACQIGNVGLHKEANMTAIRDHNIKFPPTGALDGQLATGAFNSRCAHPSNVNTIPAEWWADLGDIYRIYNITIYGRPDCCEERLQKFDLTIYNTSDNEMLCAYHNGIIKTHETIICNKPVIGRYVHFIRKGGREIHVTALCEVVIIGHKVYDCSNCPADATCDDVTGCQACSGSYQPECKPECRQGSYGINCNQRCGHCKTENKCQNVNGQCLDGCQLWWADDKCLTYIDKPIHKNESIEVLSTTSDSVKVKLQKLTSISANLSQFYGYVVVYKDVNTTNYTEVVSRSHNTSGDVFVAEIRNLNFNTKYDIQVWTYREMNGERDIGSLYQTLHVKTTCKAPDTPVVWNVTVYDTDREHLPNITVFYQSVAQLSANCHHITNISLNYKLTEDEQYSQVILSPTDNMYTIIPDNEGQYEIWITVTNNEGYSSQSDKYTSNIKRGGLARTQTSKTVTIPAVVSVAVLVAVGVSILLVLIWKRRKKSPSAHQYINRSFINNDLKNEPGENHNYDSALNDEACNGIEIETTQSHAAALDDITTLQNDTETAEDECLYANSAISVVNFEGYVAKRKKSLKDLYKEYELLPERELQRCQVAVAEENQEKNRFRNIYAYDDTRVLLDVADNNNGDYINATYITGYNKPKEYIATQGPRKNTLIDLWRMVWQENTSCIVMVANVSEMGKKKVEPYWCESVGESRLLGDFNIKAESLETSADYDIRIMTVKKGDEYRTVHHFHFKTWEDKGKPRFGPHTLLAFMDRVHSVHKHSQGPLIVHCSAGVGRTGSFIALDILQQMAIKDKSVDIYNCVERLRRERMLMVQTKEQYIFLHEAMVEFIKYMNTSHDCNKFTQKFASVCDPQPDPGIMAIVKKEFKHLSELKSWANKGNISGLNEENRNKNRNLDIVPGDAERLFISGENGNYINAVLVDSYAAHDSTVVTQMPLPHTAGDFWNLVMEQNCQAIVMLNDLDKNEPTCIPYWPEEVNSKKTYGQLEVELLATDVDKISDFIVRREFTVKEIKHKKFAPPQVITVRHFQLKSWPNDDILPQQRIHLLELINQMENWQKHNKQSSEKWTILVHCIDGGSHSGMFCAASFMLDKIKIEQDLNAYLAARTVIKNRPQFFSNIVEYQFLYQMAMEYLTQSNEYVNIR